MSDRVILAYSGGLDTSVAISWIGKETGREVVAVAIDLGQGGEDMEVVRQRAVDCGAVEAVVVDARDEFAEEHKDVVEAFLRAQLEATDFLHENPLEASEIVAEETGLPAEVVYLYNGRNGVSSFDPTIKEEQVEALHHDV